MKRENRNGKEKKLSGLKIFGFACLALAVSGLVWFFTNVM